MSSSKQTIRSLLTFCTALVIGAALIAAPMTAAAASSKTEDKQMEDSWITAKTKIALFADARVKGRQINVETKDGLVMIRGKVDSDEAKKAAEEIAKLVDGVKSVKNELQVVAPSMREAVEYKDDTITSQVKEDIKKEPRLMGLNIDVKTNAGNPPGYGTPCSPVIRHNGLSDCGWAHGRISVRMGLSASDGTASRCQACSTAHSG